MLAINEEGQADGVQERRVQLWLGHTCRTSTVRKPAEQYAAANGSRVCG